MPQQSPPNPEHTRLINELMRPEYLRNLSPDEQNVVNMLAKESGFIGQPNPADVTGARISAGPGVGEKMLSGLADMASPANIGGAIGMLAGSQVGMPGVGAAVGGGVGKGLGVAADVIGGAKIPPDIMSQMVTESAFQGGAQLVPTMIGAGLKKMFMPRASTYGPSTRAVEKQFESMGFEALPSEIQEGRGQGALEKFAGKSIGGRNTLGAFLEARSSKSREWLDKFLSQVSNDPNGRSLQLVSDAIKGPKVPTAGSAKGASDLFHEAASDFYGEIDRALAATRSRQGTYDVKESIGGTGAVDTANFKLAAQKLLTERGAVDQASSILSRGSGSELLQQVIQGTPAKMTFQDAQKLRSRLMNVLRDKETIFGSEGERTIATLSGAVDFAMEKAAKDAGPEALNLWRQANLFYKRGAEIFHNELVMSVADSAPELLIQMIRPKASGGFGGTPLDDVRALKASILGRIETPEGFSMLMPKDSKARAEQAWRGIGRGIVEKALNESTVVAGRPDAGRLLGGKFLQKISAYGDDVLREVFDPSIYGKDFLPELRAFGDVAARMENTQRILGTPSNTLVEFGQGGLVILNLPGAVKDIGEGDVSGLAGRTAAMGTVLLPGYALAKIMTTPNGLKWLTEGFKAPVNAGTRSAAIATRLLTMAGASTYAHRNEPAKAQP